MHKCIQITQSKAYCNTSYQSQKAQLKALNKAKPIDFFKLWRGFIMLGTTQIQSKFPQEFTNQGPELQHTILQPTSTGESTSVLQYNCTWVREEMQRREQQTCHDYTKGDGEYVGSTSCPVQFFLKFNSAQRFCRQV